MNRTKSKTPREREAVGGARAQTPSLPNCTEVGRERGRPGRRSAKERRDAVLAMLSGKSSVDQIAKSFGVHAKTVEGWREDALDGISEALKKGSGKSARELELEREVECLREALTDSTMQVSLLQREMGIKLGPTLRRRSRR